jgi:predicted metal-dependent enzyme (double-stranded beta helix superfamily)
VRSAGGKDDDGAAYFASYDIDCDANPGWIVDAIPATIERCFGGSHALLLADEFICTPVKEEPMRSYETIEDFIADVKATLAAADVNDDLLERLAAVMRDLISSPVVGQVHDELAGNIHQGQQSGPLYTDESGLTLVRGRFEPDALTPIHNHGSWGIIGVYRGRDRYQIWRRLDSGDGAGPARVELVEERVLGPGDVAILPPPPQDIHAQQGLDGAPAYEFVLFGANTMVLPRLYFDPARGTALEVQLGAR